MANLNKRHDDIRNWSCDKGLDKADPFKQMVKIQEEVGELAAAMLRNNQEKIVDGIGDIFVVLTILSQQMGLTLPDCVEAAWQEIKDRQGKMKNGAFVKDEDLINEVENGN